MKINLKTAEVMMRGWKGKRLKSKVDVCAQLGWRIIKNSTLRTKCR